MRVRRAGVRAAVDEDVFAGSAARDAHAMKTNAEGRGEGAIAEKGDRKMLQRKVG